MLKRVAISQLLISNILTLMPADRILNPRLHSSECSQIQRLTGTWPLMMTSSAKRTLTGLVFNFAFLAALMNADLGDCSWGKKEERKAKIKRTNTLEKCFIWQNRVTSYETMMQQRGLFVQQVLKKTCISWNTVRYNHNPFACCL